MTMQYVQVFEGKTERGCVGENPLWWFDPKFPHAFSMFDLDGFYPDPYFDNWEHVPQPVIKSLVSRMIDMGKQIYGKDQLSVLELGCAGGWFTQEMLDRGIDVFAVEGSHAGYAKTLARGIPESRVLRQDLRRPLNLGRQFDMVLCTEVAEHIECPFAAQLVYHIVNHSKFAWFSFQPPTTENHYHHPNNQPPMFWRNIFRFLNYEFEFLAPQYAQGLAQRGCCLAFAKDLPVPPTMYVPIPDPPRPTTTLGVSWDERKKMHQQAGKGYGRGFSLGNNQIR